MTEQELNELAQKTQDQANAEIKHRWRGPLTSTHTVDLVIDHLIIADNWDYEVLHRIGAAPQVILLRWKGEVR